MYVISLESIVQYTQLLIRKNIHFKIENRNLAKEKTKNYVPFSEAIMDFQLKSIR